MVAGRRVPPQPLGPSLLSWAGQRKCTDRLGVRAGGDRSAGALTASTGPARGHRRHRSPASPERGRRNNPRSRHPFPPAGPACRPGAAARPALAAAAAPAPSGAAPHPPAGCRPSGTARSCPGPSPGCGGQLLPRGSPGRAGGHRLPGRGLPRGRGAPLLRRPALPQDLSLVPGVSGAPQAVPAWPLGWAVASGGPGWEPAGVGAIGHGGTCWHRLTGAARQPPQTWPCQPNK